MDKIMEMKSKRFKFLEKLYEITEGSKFCFVNMWGLGEELWLSRKDTEVIVEYLVGEGLVKYVALGGQISITHWGVSQVEEALTEPDKSTEYFPPINIININSMVGSQIQQGTNNSTQTGTFSTADIDKIRSFVDEIAVKISDLNINKDNMDELNAEVATVRAQTSSTRPKHNIIKESLKTIRNILEGMAGSILATELLNKLYTIIS